LSGDDGATVDEMASALYVVGYKCRDDDHRASTSHLHLPSNPSALVHVEHRLPTQTRRDRRQMTVSTSSTHGSIYRFRPTTMTGIDREYAGNYYRDLISSPYGLRKSLHACIQATTKTVVMSMRSVALRCLLSCGEPQQAARLDDLVVFSTSLREERSQAVNHVRVSLRFTSMFLRSHLRMEVLRGVARFITKGLPLRGPQAQSFHLVLVPADGILVLV
jgi:hypothetical protein